MTNKSRQQNQNVKARKAKARTQAKQEHRSWIDRPRHVAKGPKPLSSALAGMSARLSMTQSMFSGTGPGGSLTPEDRERNERTLCRIMGEPFHTE